MMCLNYSLTEMGNTCVFHITKKSFSVVILLMVSSIGWKLNSLTPITGFGYRRVHHHHHRHTGRGIGRRAIGSLVGHLGHALVNRVSSAISGTGRTHRRRVHRAGSYRITGTGTTR